MFGVNALLKCGFEFIACSPWAFLLWGDILVLTGAWCVIAVSQRWDSSQIHQTLIHFVVYVQTGYIVILISWKIVSIFSLSCSFCTRTMKQVSEKLKCIQICIILDNRPSYKLFFCGGCHKIICKQECIPVRCVRPAINGTPTKDDTLLAKDDTLLAKDDTTPTEDGTTLC